MIAVLGECVADAFTTRPSASADGGSYALPEPEADPGFTSRPSASPDSGGDSRGFDRDGRGGHGLELRVLPGGGPANTAVALARLGTPARFLGRLSGDVFGDLFRGHLAASGVDLSGCVEAAEPSTLAVAALDADGRADYTFYAEGAADWQWSRDELAPARLGAAACLHTGSLALVRAPGRAAVEEFARAASAHATISVDPNVRPSLAAKDDYQVARWCSWADILRLSDDDLEFLLPGVSQEHACDTWHEAGARLVVITRGAAGALVSLDGERATVPAPEVEVVDTVGAGDSFTAGLLHRLHAGGHLGGRLDGLDLGTATEAAAFAAHVAALTCSVPGANPPWAAQLTSHREPPA
ncbi:carbohydrate kinase [Nonomuraea sp. LP-02]|uniref:carbohydrate kinase family protein n=1 Tax=Nonomuraea sp. LP-02 TaxID=3097960 RepID=UPI002E381B57|nr:carbohydrate kinase [Nonomuraea sp. LP-02]MED7924905.1 carbohydrate kinase [Nonomuraea sp. LP-02]